MLFSKSPLWQLQRQYFKEAHVNAWREGDVPHYVTSNPHMAEAYAELLLAFFRDRVQAENAEEPIYIIELGTGSGRFSYHLLKALIKRCENLALQLPGFVYVMTDFVEETLGFWEKHPRLQPFFEQGLLDIALFDAEKDTVIHLRKADKILSPKTLSQPLVAIGNYFFDSIPQELFYINQGNIQHALVELIGNNGNDDTEVQPAKDILEDLEINYTYKTADFPLFDDPLQNQILEQYRSVLEDSHLLFPYTGLRCISRLKELSVQGLILITADKGVHRLEEWQHRPAPYIAKHGSFSLTVNYHALKMHCELLNGKALFPKNYQSHINVGVLLYLESHQNYRETLRSYSTAVNDFGPDDYFSIKKHVEKQIPELAVKDMFAYTRLSGYDARLFSQFIPRFRELLTEFSDSERYAFLQIIIQIWDGFYPLGEDKDLAFELGMLLIELQFYNEALTFFGLSEQIYGKTAESLYLSALCNIALENTETAKQLLQQLLIQFPDLKGARELLESLSETE